MPSIAKGLLPARRVAGWACSASSPGTAWPTCTGAMASISASKPGRLAAALVRSEEHTSELQSQSNLVCRLLLEKKKENLYFRMQGSEFDNDDMYVDSPT